MLALWTIQVRNIESEIVIGKFIVSSEKHSVSSWSNWWNTWKSNNLKQKEQNNGRRNKCFW